VRGRGGLTARVRVAVVADEELLVGGPEEAGPVHRVVVAQAAVLGDVDVPGADLVQRLQLQRRNALLLQHQQGDAAAGEADHVEQGEGGEWWWLETIIIGIAFLFKCKGQWFISNYNESNLYMYVCMYVTVHPIAFTLDGFYIAEDPRDYCTVSSVKLFG